MNSVLSLKKEFKNTLKDLQRRFPPYVPQLEHGYAAALFVVAEWLGKDPELFIENIFKKEKR